MSDEAQVRARSQRDGGWFWMQNEVVDLFGPLIGLSGYGAYTVLCRNAGREGRVDEVRMSLRAIADESFQSKDAVARSMRKMIVLGMVTEKRRGVKAASAYIVNDLKELARLGVAALRVRLADAERAAMVAKAVEAPAAKEAEARQNHQAGHVVPATLVALRREMSKSPGPEPSRRPESEADGICLSQRQMDQGAEKNLLDGGCDRSVSLEGQNCPAGETDLSRWKDTLINNPEYRILNTTPLPPDGGSCVSRSIGDAVARVQSECDLCDPRLTSKIARAMTAYMRKSGKDAASVAELMIGNRRAYIEFGEFLRFTWGPAKFFEQGHWINRQGWPLDQAAMERRSNASIGSAVLVSAGVSASRSELDRVKRYLETNAVLVGEAQLSAPADGVAAEVAARLRALALGFVAESGVEALDQALTMLEEKLFEVLLASAPEEELAELEGQASRELAPYVGKMPSRQLQQVERQFLQKRLLEARKLPRLSLFYMGHE